MRLRLLGMGGCSDGFESSELLRPVEGMTLREL